MRDIVGYTGTGQTLHKFLDGSKMPGKTSVLCRCDQTSQFERFVRCAGSVYPATTSSRPESGETEYLPVLRTAGKTSPAIHFWNGRASGLSDRARKKYKPCSVSTHISCSPEGVIIRLRPFHSSGTCLMDSPIGSGFVRCASGVL